VDTEGSGLSEPEIKVTTIGDRHHARLILNGEVLDEMACDERCDIGWICREMLRWHNKLGYPSEFAAAARRRQTGTPVGRIWYRGDLPAK
jgi:hypothetical protein